MGFLNKCSKKSPISNFTEICQVGAALIHEGGRTDGQTKGPSNLTKLIGAFPKYAKALKDK